VAGWSPLFVDDGVRDGAFVVRTAEGGDPQQRFFWEVSAVRRDVPALDTEPRRGDADDGRR